MFKINQKVVCIGQITTCSNGESTPKVGSIYTVRELNDEGVKLVEIINEPRLYRQGFLECSFVNYRFKPLQEERGTATIEDFIEVKQTNEITFYN